MLYIKHPIPEANLVSSNAHKTTKFKVNDDKTSSMISKD